MSASARARRACRQGLTRQNKRDHEKGVPTSGATPGKTLDHRVQPPLQPPVGATPFAAARPGLDRGAVPTFAACVSQDCRPNHRRKPRRRAGRAACGEWSGGGGIVGAGGIGAGPGAACRGGPRSSCSTCGGPDGASDGVARGAGAGSSRGLAETVGGPVGGAGSATAGCSAWVESGPAGGAGAAGRVAGLCFSRRRLRASACAITRWREVTGEGQDGSVGWPVSSSVVQ